MANRHHRRHDYLIARLMGSTVNVVRYFWRHRKEGMSILRHKTQNKTSGKIMSIYQKKLQEASDFLAERVKKFPRIAVILGSGLGNFADELDHTIEIPTKEIPHYPISTVPGHAGRWVFGEVSGKYILAMKGRVHFYEGYPMEQVVFPAHLMATIGVQTLLVTNASGGVNPLFEPGDLMLIEDHINLFFANPLRGKESSTLGPRFPDMSQPYNKELQALALRVAQEEGILLKKGVLVGSRGPTYETAAEIRMFQRLGGDAATMSTVPEVIAANQRGLRVLGISCITNMATGLSAQPLTHEEVTLVADQVQQKFHRLVKAILQAL